MVLPSTLEAGVERPGRPAVLLLHGFPELAYSWRKVMLPLAAAGYHVIAPDQRGYGRTTGWDGSYGADPDSLASVGKRCRRGKGDLGPTTDAHVREAADLLGIQL